MSKIRACIETASPGDSSVRSSKDSGSSVTTRSGTATGSSDMTTVLRRPSDPEEDLRLMAQEVRDYVEAVLNSLAANVPKAVVLCQVERAKDAMLNQLYSSISAQSTGRIQELLQEDQEVKTRRERCQKQAAALAKLTRTLGLHESRASVSSVDDSSESQSPGIPEAEDWRVAFESAGSRSSSSRSSDSPLRSSNGDVGGSRRTPGRSAPPPPPNGGSMYKY